MAMAEKKNKKILVVDDSETHLDITEVMLQDLFDITLASSGEEALNMLMNGYIPNLVMLDIVMPEMDGWEAYNRIRAISFLNDVPIVFVTSSTGDDVKRRAFELGAADFIQKPLDRDDTIVRIRSILGIRKDADNND